MRSRFPGARPRFQRLVRIVAVVAMSGAVELAADANEGWIITEVDPSTGVESKVAVIENGDGFRLSVERGSSGRSALCSFRLPEESSDPLARDERLTVLVDSKEPLTIMRWQGPEKSVEDGDDFMEVRRRTSGVVPLARQGADRASFWCWRALKDQSSPASGLLRQILDGEELTVGFGLAEGGDQETKFSLDGAGQSISQALAISAQPTVKDMAQDELLGFRVNYRSTTCYLLQGKKRQKRCLERVNRCAQQTHDSVLSMRECVEGK